MKKMILVASWLLSTVLVTNAQSSTGNPTTDNNLVNNKNAYARFLNPGRENKNILTSKGLAYPGEQPDHLKKSKNQKITAWSLLGGGVVCTGIGILVIPKNYDLLDSSNEQDSQLGVGSVTTILEFASMLTGIPFFVSSGIYKRKASIGAVNQKTGFGAPPHVSSDIAGITMTLSIGK